MDENGDGAAPMGMEVEIHGRGIYPIGGRASFMGDIFEVKGDIDEIRAGFLFYGRNPEYKGELSIIRQILVRVSRNIPKQVFNSFYERYLLIYARDSRYMREKFILCAKSEIHVRTVDYLTKLDTATSRIPSLQPSHPHIPTL
ncbi:hypothetical protein [Rossellomorea aquimaris]|uniref:Uncharacterized protein n=1 Tax=Rossellomorea aquimaris TaxID=189382 RepID=A0A1J6VX06_9BACI|nr:hypothetical protein [Rossellomorea aquimaris]OIU70382.1 hypothetical protein BHE18_11720 [Rossellomorea aquimaris]